MRTDRPAADDRVLRFEPRGRARNTAARPTNGGAAPPDAGSPVADIKQFERTPEDPGEYRHRQWANLAGFAVCVVLIVIGIWIADRIAELRRDQDCVLAGRRNCAQISVWGDLNR